jgi:uncharacterized membrane protein YfhO
MTETTQFTFPKMDKYIKEAHSFVANLAATRPFRFYLLLVVIVYAVIYLPLPLTGKMFIYLDIGADTYAYYWPMYAFLRDFFHDFWFDGWSFQHGVGASLISAAPLLFDPFNLFILPFSKNNIDTGIFLAATAKVFSLALLAYGYIRRLGYRGVPLIASSISYTFCGFFIGWGQHYHFATTFVLFTLVMYCFEGWLQSFHWLGFVLAIALLAAYWPYSLFMTLVFLAVYYLFRYLQLFRFNGRDFFTRSFATAGLVFWGMALGAVFFLPQVYAITQSSRINAQILPSLSLATRNEYYTMFMRLFSNGLLGVNYFSGHLNYYEAPFLYAGILTIILIPRLVLDSLRKKVYLSILLVCIFTLVFPRFVNPFFGAFSSNSYRWTFVLVPVLSIALAEAFSVIHTGSHKWVYSIGIFLAVVAGIAALFLNHPMYPGILGLSIPLSVAIVVMSAVLYGLVLFGSHTAKTPYWLLAVLTLEIALTGYVSVNWRGTVPISDKAVIPYFDPSTEDALEKLSSQDQSFFRINKNYDEIYLTDALFQGFYGEKQYSSITPGYIRDMEELFGLREARSNYLTGFAGRQALRDVSAVKYMLTMQKHSYAGYDYVDQAGDVHIFRNNNASLLGIVYKNYISFDNFQKLDWAGRQYILYEAAVVPPESRKHLSSLNEVDVPLLRDLSIISVDRNFAKYQLKVVEDDFPNHLEITSKEIDPQLAINLSEPANTSVAVAFSVTSSIRSTGRVYFKTLYSDYNENDSTSFTLQPGNHHYYVILPALGVNAIRLDVAQAPGTFSIDNFAVFQRDDEGIAKQASLLSRGINVDMFMADYIRATSNLDEGSLVYFSIPFDQGWKVYIDGQLTEKIRANIAFTGVYVQPGKHTIELKYAIPWLKEGTVISILALLLGMVLWAKTQKDTLAGR